MGKREGVEWSRVSSHSEWQPPLLGVACPPSRAEPSMWVSTKTKLLTPGKCHVDEKFPRLLWKERFPASVQLPGQWDPLPLCSDVVLAWLSAQTTGFFCRQYPNGALQGTYKQAPRCFILATCLWLPWSPAWNEGDGRMEAPWKRRIYGSRKLKIILVLFITTLLMLN